MGFLEDDSADSFFKLVEASECFCWFAYLIFETGMHASAGHVLTVWLTDDLELQSPCLALSRAGVASMYLMVHT